jgi:hypothetical protein
MPRETPSPVIVASFARTHSIEQLDTAIAQLSEGVLTGQFQNLSVLGMSIGNDPKQATLILETMEAARNKATAEADEAVGDIALDDIKPLGHGMDFSGRLIS